MGRLKLLTDKLGAKLRGKKKIDAAMWREIYWNPTRAKEALINLEVPADNGKLAKVTHLDLESGLRIPVKDVSEKQAHEFMKKLCPSWAHTKGVPK